jgi:DNA repair exonuclease SbcCD ATPase subunit
MQAEIERLEAEVTRLRELERGLRRERERVRAEAAAEIERLQIALREAAAHAGERRDDIGSRIEAAAAAERALDERERRLRARSSAFDEGERRLALERERLQRESARLAEWERAARMGAPPGVPAPTSFSEGLGRLSAGSGVSRSSNHASW